MNMERNSGFTLVEVIAVFVVLTIVTMVVASFLLDYRADLTARTGVIKSHLCYAQSRAMNSSVIWGIVFAGSTYSLYRDKDGDNIVDNDEKVRLPAEDSDAVALPSGMTVSGAGIVSFDSWGSPFTDAAAQTPQSGARTITVSMGSDTSNLRIIPNTGFIW
ncbi:MAG: type II secretion system protein [Thermodesulfobacteriota bacterium]|nr:type II secretion system protein [Thermodesulfobacteriota bacterium]